MNPLLRDWLNWSDETRAETDAGQRIFCARRPSDLRVENGTARLAVPFQPHVRKAGGLTACGAGSAIVHELCVHAFGDDIVRVTLGGGGAANDASPMLQRHPSLQIQPLNVRRETGRWIAFDDLGRMRLQIDVHDPPARQWSRLMAEPDGAFAVSVVPDGKTRVPFMAWDTFSPGEFNSLPLAYTEHVGEVQRVMFSLHADANECFAGTGERFAKMDLSGRTIDLQNADALGVNNRRAYKNVPFYISSRGYGLLMLTSAHARLSLADLSTRAAMGLVEHDMLDLFFIAGGSIERILYNYRRLTGFPQEVPIWSYGTWMGRMTYLSAAEVKQAATRMREERFPCDVMHIDTGWFKEDWACDWQFCTDKFPEDEKFIASLRELGYRVSLWQLPKVSVKTPLFAQAAAEGILPARRSRGESAVATAGGSNFGTQRYAGSIDLTHPRAAAWYRRQLGELFAKGVAAIKADFGEEIDMSADYHAARPELLHNLYALLYQKLIYEATQEAAGGDKVVIWARAGWIGCQRYPVHWAGDAACTWDGLAASIRGGLHLGLSGFGFWSHDVPGFHGVPSFMNCWPSDELYVRWTQAAVFGSHLRYHGAQPREPYEYPRVSDIVRQWLKLRYALIPYLIEQGRKTCQSGYPVLRAMLLHHADDPVCWHIDDQFFCGDNLLIAPIVDERDVRDVYLPAGTWIDLWTGQQHAGERWLRQVGSPLMRIPVYARAGCSIPIYPKQVLCTDEMNWSEVCELHFDATFQGLARSAIGERSSWEITL